MPELEAKPAPQLLRAVCHSVKKGKPSRKPTFLTHVNPTDFGTPAQIVHRADPLLPEVPQRFEGHVQPGLASELEAVGHRLGRI